MAISYASFTHFRIQCLDTITGVMYLLKYFYLMPENKYICDGN